MIGHLEGRVVRIRDGFAILTTHGVGYKVSIPKGTLMSLSEGTTASLWTHLAVREDALDLYGFETEAELRIFELLLTVSGIGPKSALGIVNIAAIETLRAAIAQGNAGYLTNVSGIGKKTAEKIILELREKIGLGTEESSGALKGDEEALQAMRALGYSPAEARDALRKVPHDVTHSNDRLREALRIIGNQ